MMPVKIPALLILLFLPFVSLSQEFLKKDYFLHDTTEIHIRLEVSEPQKQLLGIAPETKIQEEKTSAEILGDGYISQSATTKIFLKTPFPISAFQISPKAE